MSTIACILLSLYYAWRYSRTEIDPDWAMFNLWGFTGAAYGRDFVDCKMPGIHLWYLAITKVVGRNIQRVKFTHHLLISLPGVIVGGWVGLTYIVIVNAGQLIAFHGNVGQPAAAFVFLAMWLDQPIVSSLLVLLAVCFESKLMPVVLFLSLASGWGLTLLLLTALAGGAGVSLKWIKPDWWVWLWEANIIIPQRMMLIRRKMLEVGDHKLFPWYTARGMAYIAPWLTLGVMYRPDVMYWLPVAVYLALIFFGIVVRPNHLIVLAPWIAWAGMPAMIVVALVLADWIGSGFYLGDLWNRFYTGLREPNIEAREVGEWLKDRAGRLWVNTYHTAIYIYAGKPPIGGLVEQFEIRESSPERREAWRREFKKDCPEWVVQGDQPGWEFRGTGYEAVAENRLSKVYRKAKVRW